MRVEVATPEDAAEIAALGQLLHDTSSYAAIPYRAEKVEVLMRSLAAGAGAVFVVRRDGAIVGGIAGGVTAHWFSDELLGFEYSFFIEPTARNGFVAIKLIAAFKTWCKQQGAKRVRIGDRAAIGESSLDSPTPRSGSHPSGACEERAGRADCGPFGNLPGPDASCSASRSPDVLTALRASAACRQ